MKLLRMAAVLAWLGSGALAAEAPAYPFQLALFAPVELIAPDHSINGLRLNLIYGANADVNGMDLGLINFTTHDHRGLQLGLVNLVGGDLTGYNMGLVNWTGGQVAGSEVGLVNWAGGEVAGTQDSFLFNVARAKVAYQYSLGLNWAGEVAGGQFGGINRATKMTGLQLGFLNLTGQLNGLQIGLLNFALEKEGPWKVLPLINANW